MTSNNGNIAVYGDKLFATAFKLAGLLDVHEVDVSQPSDRLAEVVNAAFESGYTLAIIQDKLMSSLPAKVRKRVEASTRPLFVVISLEGEDVEGASIREMVKKALGVELR